MIINKMIYNSIMNNNTYATKMYLYKLNIVLSKEYINYMYNYLKTPSIQTRSRQ